MPRIFICYRREDSGDITGRIYDRLKQHFGDDSVFKDVHCIPTGSDFRQVIADSIVGCHAVLVVVGPGWSGAADRDGRRRLADPSDFVRLEIEGAFRCGHPVLPLLVNDADMPRSDELPDSLIDFAHRSAARIHPDPVFDEDMTRLVRDLETMFAAQRRLAEAGPMGQFGPRPAGRPPAGPGRQRPPRRMMALALLVAVVACAAVAYVLFGRPKPAAEADVRWKPERTATLAYLHTLAEEDRFVEVLAVSAAGDRVAVLASPDGMASPVVSVWEVATGKRECALAFGEADADPVLAAFHPSTPRLVVLTKASELIDFDAGTGARGASVGLRDADGPTELTDPTDLLFCADGRTVFIAAAGDPRLASYDATTGKRLRVLCLDLLDDPGERPKRGARAHPPLVGRTLVGEGKWAVAAHEDGNLRLWELSSRTCLRTYEPAEVPPFPFGQLGDLGAVPPVPAPAEKDGADKPAPIEIERPRIPEGLLPHFGKELQAAHRGGVVGLDAGQMFGVGQFGAFGGAQLGVLGGQLQIGGVGQFGALGGAQLGALGALGGAQLGVLGGQPGLVLPESYGFGTLDGPGRRLAAVLTNSDIQVRDKDSGQVIQNLNVRGADVSKFDKHAIRYAAFHPDGRTLLSGGADRAIRFWDVDTGKRFFTHEGHSDEVVFLRTCLDGKLLLLGAADGTVRVWDLRLGWTE